MAERLQALSGFRAGLIMLFSVTFFGLVPLVLTYGEGHNPFLFAAGMRFGLAPVPGLVLLLCLGRRFLLPGMWRFLWCRLWSWPALFVLISYVDVALLGWSFDHAAPAVGAALYETWPIFLILIVAWGTGGRFRHGGWSLAVLLLVALVGVFLVVGSQGDGGSGGAGAGGNVGWGLLLAVLAALLTGVTGFSWVWAHHAERAWLAGPGGTAPGNGNSGRGSVAVVAVDNGAGHSMAWGAFFLLFLLLVVDFAAAVLNLILGLTLEVLGLSWFTSESVSRGFPLSLWLMALVGGAASYGLGSICWRYASMLTANVGIHAVSYLTPVAALFFLWVMGRSGPVEATVLLAGVSVLLTANVMLTLQGGVFRRWPLTALSLLGGGVVTLLLATG